VDDAKIVALLSSIEPSEGEIPKPPFMAAIPAGPALQSGADAEAIDAWVKARGGWTHRTPAHLAGPQGGREPLFYIVPRGHLAARPGGAPAYVPAPAKVSPGVAGGTPARGLAAAPLMAFAATNDLPAARAFYERGLGLPMTGQSPIACTFDAGGTTLRVVAVEKPVIAPYTVLGWTVPDIRATIGDLKRRGIDFERFDGVEQDELGVWSAPGGALVAWFKDPDCNTLSLTQF